MLNIVTVNYPLEGDGIVNSIINGAETLLDADLVILNPKDFRSSWENYMHMHRDGFNRITSPNSKRFSNIFNARHQEMETLLEKGKVIIVFMSPIDGFKAEYGEPLYRSEVLTNYESIPGASHYLESFKTGKSGGANSVRLQNQSYLFSSYYYAFKDELEYDVYLDYDSEEKNINFLVNRSNKPVGFYYGYENGVIAFLPPPKYKNDNEKLVGVLCECAKRHLTDKTATPPPEWINEYIIKGEDVLNKEITTLDNARLGIKNEILKLEEQKKSLTKFKTLLYEQGTLLEEIVIESFELMGFKAHNRKEGDLEHDIIFESTEGRGIAEVEGKDKDAIHTDKFDQLNRVVDEDEHLTGEYPQGVLIGNHFRLSKPESRKEPFTEKVLKSANRKRFGLLTTLEIFNAVQKIIDNPTDDNYKTECRKRILTTEGEIIKLT